jgi:hypothetical protein
MTEVLVAAYEDIDAATTDCRVRDRLCRRRT